ncbi:hypothetical protein FFWV33_03625 [Flavobacterium faecale]|uniref:Chemotaxis methyl-accepting receptor HlyB-like 4HB MCP domain-containing protein n=1 Tax=Flavobacterium faecale TaxID=1355330 RepID=A0A2S1LAE2_9FLAO|nr:hypothetical protein [Flavobacterium faecale]AWG20691.1 hypothetical protein FFWV33_03625 [Flavobacterium faecale]
MKDIKQLNRKSKAAMVLIFVTLLLLISNYFIGQNSKKTNEHIRAIYNDRLLVSHYIFQYNNTIHQIIAAASQPKATEGKTQIWIQNQIEAMEVLHKKYLQTVLTIDEQVHFSKLQQQCTQLVVLSEQYRWEETTYLAHQTLLTLTTLSQLQIDEGKTTLTTANALHSGNQLVTQFEVGLFILLGCLSMYLLVLKKMKYNIKIPQAPSLN